jgi:hypothetical protein
MRRKTRALVVAAAATLASGGCAPTLTLKDTPIAGREVTVVSEGRTTKGELLVVDKDALWLRAKDGVHELPLRDVRDVRVKRHGFGARQALIWTGVGAAASGIGLSAACSSVEGANNCGTVGAVTAGVWLLVGALAAPAFESSSRIDLPSPSAEALRPWARLPQGMPPGVSPSSLSAPPGEPRD